MRISLKACTRFWNATCRLSIRKRRRLKKAARFLSIQVNRLINIALLRATHARRNLITHADALPWGGWSCLLARGRSIQWRLPTTRRSMKTSSWWGYLFISMKLQLLRNVQEAVSFWHGDRTALLLMSAWPWSLVQRKYQSDTHTHVCRHLQLLIISTVDFMFDPWSWLACKSIPSQKQSLMKHHVVVCDVQIRTANWVVLFRYRSCFSIDTKWSHASFFERLFGLYQKT